MASYQSRLSTYKTEIDKDLANYSKDLLTEVKRKYGTNSELVISAYTSILLRGGKRIRGALTKVGYELGGGKDNKVAVLAARATEIIQAYLLITDDVFDRSPSRRGGPSAHYLLMEYHKKNYLKDDTVHFGESMAYMAGSFASHEAIRTLCQMPVDPKLIREAIDITNQNIQVTWQGQINDVFNEVEEKTTLDEAMKVISWKTAHYTFVSPLVLGATLANANQTTLDKLKNYGIHAGIAFQLMNDISDTFNHAEESGKDPRDDIREGKMTPLIIHTLSKLDNKDSEFLKKCLGNPKLDNKDFEICKKLIESSGGKKKVCDQAKREVASAIKAIGDTKGNHADFLNELALSLTGRKV